MSFGPDDKKIETAGAAIHLILEVVGLALPPIAIIANDEQAAVDLYTFFAEHASSKPGLARLPGPPLVVRYPAKF